MLSSIIKSFDPFISGPFRIFKNGIWDDPKCNVYINEEENFAFLYPQPIVDYYNYLSRCKILQLQNNKLFWNERRIFKINSYIEKLKIKAFISKRNLSLIEIGSSKGEFLISIHKFFPDIELNSVEIDQNSFLFRKKINCREYESIDQVYGQKFDIICLFHVLEHIINFKEFLYKIKSLLHENSLLVIEVPSIEDPLFTLYQLEKYKNFYFQKQHPFIYSRVSLKSLMEYFGFSTEKIIPFQRYGLINHLNWIIKSSPGGNPLFQEIFKQSEISYILDIEEKGLTDSVIWLGNLKST